MSRGKSLAGAPEKAASPPAVDKQPLGATKPLGPVSAMRVGDRGGSARPSDGAGAGRARSIGALQRSLGNARLERLLSPAAGGEAPAGVAVSPPDSPSEREAESVAQRVTAGRVAPPVTPTSPATLGTLRRQQRGEDEEAQAPPVSRQPAAGAPGPGTGGPGEGAGDPGPGTGRDAVARAMNGRGPGSPVEPGLRRALEPRMGADLGGARIHRDSAANEAASAINARAFTHGRDVYLGRGESEGDTRLMAHELAHVAQNGAADGGPGQRLPIVNRQPAGGGGAPATPAPPPPAAPPPGSATEVPKGNVAPGVVELKGKAGFEPGPETVAFLEETKKGLVNVRFGNLAEGPIKVKRTGKEKYDIERSAVPLKGHPLFTGIQEHMPDLAPALIVDGGTSSVKGFVGPAAGKRVPTSDNALVAALEKAPGVLGLVGFDVPSLDKFTNKLESGSLKLGIGETKITLGGAFSGTIAFQAVDDRIESFAAKIEAAGPGLAKTEFGVTRTPEGVMRGEAAVAVTYKQVSGSIKIVWDGRALTGEGKVGYQGEKFSGEVTVFLMEKTKAAELAEQKKAPPEEAKQPATNGAAPAAGKAPAKKGKAGKEDYAVFGEGDLTFAFNEWLNGTAHVIIDHKGELTVVGKLTPQAEFILFDQKDYDKDLFKAEMRATYGLPVVGNIFVFGNVSLGAFAKIGPGKLYKIVVEGEYSTDKTKAQSFTIQCSLNVSAAAGLRLRGEAGAGIEILSHDLKAGAGVNALAGIRGYAEATPVIGYREQATEEGADKKGEFFIKGDLEIAAQPFLGLSGDLFVEVDAPWWSPVDDDKWTWPLGQKEWPIGGSFGVVASVEHVLGSKELPSIKFKPVEFSADKFLTDLYSDKAPAKSGERPEQPGKWTEKNEKTAEPPEKGATKGVPPGKGEPPPPAKADAAPKGTKQAGKPAEPNARTAEGKSVKELQDEAAKKGKKPDGPQAGKEAGKSEAAKKDAPASEAAEKDVTRAQGLVRSALQTELPKGAKHVDDVTKVLVLIAPKAKPGLINLRAEEVSPGKPKDEGAIAYKVKGSATSGKDVLISGVRYSQEGTALTDEERWKKGVDGVKRELSRLVKRDISAATILAQFPRWEKEFGFKVLSLSASRTPWVIEGEMSPGKPVAPVPGTSTVMSGLSKDQAIPIVWFKSQHLYVETIELNHTTLHRDERTTVPIGLSGQAITFGVLPKYWPRIGKKMQYLPTERGATVDQIRAVLDNLGMRRRELGVQIDHVQDLQFGGPDLPENLWPYDSSANMSAGPRQRDQEVDYLDDQNQPQKAKTVDLPGRWFVIKEVE